MALPSTAGGIGIGTSGYAMVLYGRTIALAALSAACAAIGLLRRDRFHFVVSYREVQREQLVPW